MSGDLGSQYEELRAELGHILREARDRKGWGQKAVADEVGISDAFISKVERVNGPPPGIATARAWARALGLDEERIVRMVVRLKILKTFEDEDVDLADISAALQGLKKGRRSLATENAQVS